MANSLTACVLLMVLTGVAADMCDYELYPDDRERTAYCSYGCCYTMIYPCCSEPLGNDRGILTPLRRNTTSTQSKIGTWDSSRSYMKATFIAPLVISIVGMFIGFIVIVIIVIRRRRTQGVPTVQYSTPFVGQQVMSSAGGVSTNPGYGYSQYVAQPMYPGQPVYGTTPMYALQSGPGGTTTMYMMPAPGGGPPAYAHQYAEGTAPPYATQTGNAPGGAPPAYANQHAEGTAPPYATQTAGGADFVPTKTPLQ